MRFAKAGESWFTVNWTLIVLSLSMSYDSGLIKVLGVL